MYAKIKNSVTPDTLKKNWENESTKNNIEKLMEKYHIIDLSGCRVCSPNQDYAENYDILPQEIRNLNLICYCGKDCILFGEYERE